jgi:fucose permease
MEGVADQSRCRGGNSQIVYPKIRRSAPRVPSEGYNTVMPSADPRSGLSGTGVSETLLPTASSGLGALFVAGLLMSLLGAILPAWRYHIETDFALIGSYFLLQNVGIIAGGAAGRSFLRRQGIAACLVLGCALAAAGLVVLGFFSPPAPVAGRLAGLLLTGLGSGVIHSGALHAIVPAYEHEPASTLTLAGVLFNLGALATALFVAGAFFVYTIQAILIVMALVPALAALLYSRSRGRGAPVVAERRWREALRDFRSPAAVLFALLLFFQLGNEGALAGWLSLYLIQRLGVSPDTSLLLLALFWGALLLGRMGGIWLMRHVPRGRLLAGAVLTPMFGCTILASTDNLFGAITAVLLTAGGFAVILPLVMERIAGRFPYFHPGIFGGIFSLAMTGGFLAPASVGYIAHFLGIGVVAWLPLLGSVAVFILYWLLVLESKLSHRPQALM